MFYDSKTKGFYLDGGDNRVEITDDYHVELFDAQAGGKVIVADDKGYPIVIEPIPPTDEERRASMVISKVKAMQNLKKVGKLNLVLDLMDALSRDNDVRILWDFSETLHRTDPTLVKVCKEELGLDDEGIDNLFL